MNNKKIISIVLIVIAVLIIVFAVSSQKTIAPEDAGRDDEKNNATSTDEGSTDILGDESDQTPEGEDEVVDKPKPPVSSSKITIPVSEYTVYMGFASSSAPAGHSVEPKEEAKAVIGYEWEALPGSQIFASVTLPEWDEKKYEVSVWEDEAYTTFGQFTSGEKIKLPREGLIGTKKFKVTGIDPALRICPSDRSFNWQVTFTFEGNMGLVRTPIVQDLPAGQNCQLR